MPIYEYECPRCGVFETTQRITEDPLRKCPTCSRKVKKLMSSTSFQLKGSGWYVTDYARKETPKESTTDTKSTTDSTSTGGESKAATDSGGAKSESSTESKRSDTKPAASKRGGKSEAKAHAA